MSNGDRRIKTFLQIFIAVLVILALLGAGQKVMNFVSEWGTAIFLSIVLTVLAELVVIKFGGESLRNYHITIWGFRVTLFFIATMAVKYLFLK
ncbi:hypothetical protein HYX07_04520 [Candidatus Woesearchaeota archaeon]|nr:hypothetical protein [Candidatus Woesearchaeota archaeon]